jgi:SP family general alpha glucoside:H+ symporter-like MFS transporter
MASVPEAVPAQPDSDPATEKPLSGSEDNAAAHIADEHVTIETLLNNDVLLAKYAEEAAKGEFALGVWGSIKLYYPAIGWALLCATCVIMEGYDTILIGNFFAYPAFANKYGTRVDERGNTQVRGDVGGFERRSERIGC